MPGALLVRGGPLWAGPGRFWARGALLIREGAVAYAGAAEGAPAPAPGEPVLEAGGGLIMPGLVNAHCHGAMTLFRGLADDVPLHAWLTEHIFPVEARWINEDSVELGSLLAAAEMLLSGTTCVGDSYFCASGAARAYQKAGMRAVVAQGLIDFPAPGVPDPARGVDVCRRFVEQWREASPLVTPAVFAHSLYTCGPDALAAAAELAAEKSVALFTHLAETKGELDQIRKAHGAGPVEHLERLGLLSAFTSAAHGVWLERDELERLAGAGVGLVHCPSSNMKLASGAGRPDAWLEAGVDAGLGSDGAASNNRLDMFAEMGHAARLAKVTAMDPAALPAEAVLAMATSGSARCLGLKGLGELRPGAPGDAIVVDLAAPNLTPVYSAPSALVYAAGGGNVRHAVVAGRVLLEDRRLLTIDLAEVRARVRELARDIAAGRG